MLYIPFKSVQFQVRSCALKESGHILPCISQKVIKITVLESMTINHHMCFVGLDRHIYCSGNEIPVKTGFSLISNSHSLFSLTETTNKPVPWLIIKGKCKRRKHSEKGIRQSFLDFSSISKITSRKSKK